MKGTAPGQPKSSIISRLPEIAPVGTVTSITVAEILLTVAAKPLKEAVAVDRFVPVTVTIVLIGPEFGDAVMVLATHSALPATVNVYGFSSVSLLII